MPPSITDYFGKASIDTDYAIATTVEATRTAGGTVLEAVDLSKYADDTPVFFVTYKKVTDPLTNEVSVVDLVSWKALVNTGANTLTNLELAPGYTDIGNDVGDFIECIPTAYWENSLINGIFVGHNPDGSFKEKAVGAAISPPQGFMLNGKIDRTISGGNLTVAIKTLDGADPTADNPVYVRIGNTVRTITGALSVTKNAGTNWFNSGSAVLATFEVDYFVYLGYNATDGVTIALARYSTGRVYGDFSTTTTSDKYGAVSTVTNATSTDEYEVVGRVNATLSAGAGYTWSTPATSVIVNRPIFHTRWLACAVKINGGTTNPTQGTGGTSDGKYQIVNDQCKYMFMYAFGTAGVAAGSGTYYLQLPFLADVTVGTTMPVTGMLRMTDNSASVTAYGHVEYDTTVVNSLSPGQNLQMTYMSTGAASGNPLGVTTTNNSSPWTWAASDGMHGDIIYRMSL